MTSGTSQLLSYNSRLQIGHVSYYVPVEHIYYLLQNEGQSISAPSANRNGKIATWFL
jgi:hypothetical protein